MFFPCVINKAVPPSMSTSGLKVKKSQPAFCGIKHVIIYSTYISKSKVKPHFMKVNRKLLHMCRSVLEAVIYAAGD